MEFPEFEETRRYADESLSEFLLRQLEQAAANSVLDKNTIETRIEAIKLSLRQERGQFSLISQEVIESLHLKQAKYVWAHLFQRCTSGRIELKHFKELENLARYNLMKAGEKYIPDSIGMTASALKELYIRQAQLWLTYSRLYAEDEWVDISSIPYQEIVPAMKLAEKHLEYIETSDRELKYLLQKNASAILQPHIKELLALSGHYAIFRIEDYMKEVLDPVLKRLGINRTSAGLNEDSRIMKAAYSRQCKYNWKYLKKNMDRIPDPQNFFSESVLFYLEAAKLSFNEANITTEDIRTLSTKISKLRTHHKKEQAREVHGAVIWRN
jgi:hypothetical protein